MKKECGFTLIELILTLVLTAILAGIVVEIIAGPIRSYFWVTQLAVRVESVEQAMDNIERELKSALAHTVKIEKTLETQTLSFRKILFKGLITPGSVDANRLPILGRFEPSLDVNIPYFLYLPFSTENDNSFTQVHIKTTPSQSVILLDSPKAGVTNDKPIPFYLVSSPIRYDCSRNAHLLERIENSDKALVNNQIQSCQFTVVEDNKTQGVYVTIIMCSKGDTPLKLTKPIFLEKM